MTYYQLLTQVKCEFINATTLNIN